MVGIVDPFRDLLCRRGDLTGSCDRGSQEVRKSMISMVMRNVRSTRETKCQNVDPEKQISQRRS